MHQGHTARAGLPYFTIVNQETSTPALLHDSLADQFAPGNVCEWSQFHWCVFYTAVLLLRFYTHRKNRKSFQIAEVSQCTVCS